MAVYPDFKSYIQANYIELITQSLSEFVSQSHDGIGFHSINVLSLCEQKVENAVVVSMKCQEAAKDLILIDVNVSADIVMFGLGTKKYECDRKSRLFIVHMIAELNDGLKVVTINGAEEYYKTAFAPEGALDEYLIPYISSDELEDEADMFCEVYCSMDDYEDGYKFPYKKVMHDMGITVFYAPLPPSEFGRMYFRPAITEYFTVDALSNTLCLRRDTIQRGTMLIDPEHYLLNDYGSIVTTIAHELIHWDKHKHFFELLDLLGITKDKISCSVNPGLPGDELSGVQKAVWWAEWQANALALRIIMPSKIFIPMFEEKYANKIVQYGQARGEAMKAAVEDLSNLFGVSRYAIKTRAAQLGYDDVSVTFVSIKGHTYPPMSFKRGTLEKNQTYIITQDNLDSILKGDHELSELIATEAFVYTGCVLCLNDTKYVELDTDDFAPAKYKLTEYGANHLDECCLRFQLNFYTEHGSDLEFYGQCYLSKAIDASRFCFCTEIEEDDNLNKKEQAKNIAILKKEAKRQSEILASLPTSFSKTFDRYMQTIKVIKNDKEGKLTNLEMANRTHLSEKYIRELRKEEKKVGFYTVCALCIGLHLPPLLSGDLIRKGCGGYPITEEGTFDKYIIENHYMENLELVNEKLEAAGYHIFGKDE